MTKEDFEKRVLDNARERGDIVQLDCGYYHFWPRMSGAISSAGLRIIADELDRLNKEWDEELRSYFDSNRQSALNELTRINQEAGMYDENG